MIPTEEIVFRTLATAMLLALAGILINMWRRRPAALPGAVFALAVAAFVVTSARGAEAWLGAWIWPATALCVTKAFWFWLFARALFRDGGRPGRREISWLGAAVLVLAVAGAWQQLVFLDSWRSGVAGAWESAAGFGVEFALAGFVLLALREAWRGLEGDLVESRRRLRVGLLTAAGAYLAVAIGVQVYNLGSGSQTSQVVVLGNLALMALGAGFAIAGLVRLGPGEWLEPARARTGGLNRIERHVLGQLRAAMERDQAYLTDKLTIGGLAERLNTQEHILRRVINRGLGHRNFNEFLHSWRIREACEELARPEQAETPVTTIALQLGYGSIGTFNRAFKARTGMTPTAFRRRSVGSPSLN